MEFRKVTIEDKQEARKLLKTEDRYGGWYTFGANFIWQDVYNAVFSFDEDCYTAKIDGTSSYFLPSGEQKHILELIEKLLSKEGKNLKLMALEECHKTLLCEHMPGVFDFVTNRDKSDYIYLREDLATLSGKKFQSKRNFIRRFKDNPDWIYEPLSDANIGECIDLNLKWGDVKHVDTKMARMEIGVANTALACFSELGIAGGLIRQDGEVVAYSIGEELNSETFIVHFEKALDIKGAYAVINNEFVKNNCTDYKYINREEDLGDEGLRKAKMSYHPAIILDKYTAKPL